MIDIKSNLTVVSLYHLEYYRPWSNFNPTVQTDNVNDLLSAPYNFTQMISLGLLESSALSVVMFKFTLFNTAMTVAYFEFV